MNHFGRCCKTNMKEEQEDCAQLSSDESSDEDCSRLETTDMVQTKKESKTKKKAFTKKMSLKKKNKEGKKEVSLSKEDKTKERKMESSSISKECKEELKSQKTEETHSKEVADKKKKKKLKYKKKKKVLVNKLDNSITAKIKIVGMLPFSTEDNNMEMATDTGVRKTILNYTDWKKIKKSCGLVKTSKKFRPYGTPSTLNIIGKAYVTMQAEAGDQRNTSQPPQSYQHKR